MTATQQPSVTQADIEKAIKATNYKYFGDYELSDDQRDAVHTLTSAAEEVVNLRAELAEAKKQSEYRSRQWTHYERLAQLFSSKEHIAHCRLQKAEAENKRLRELLEGACKGIEDGRLYDAMCCSGHECGCRGSSNADLLCHDLRAALSTQPKTEESQ